MSTERPPAIAHSDAPAFAAEHRAKLSALQAVSLPASRFAGGPAPIDEPIEERISAGG